MRLPNNSIKKIMKDVTELPIENNAIYLLSNHFEDKIRNITKLAMQLHYERNKIRNQHGLPDKKRLSEELFKEVLKNGSN